MPDPSAPPGARRAEVYFDGACPVCAREIAAYRRADTSGALHWIDASGCDAAALGPGLDRTAALARLHVRRADGRLASGAAAFVEVWRHLPGWRVLARVARAPGVLPVMEAAYRAFLHVRRLWRRAPATPAPPSPPGAHTP
jgi:predicted DCC family thiol-disulfide oxidoreductase YuxK